MSQSVIPPGFEPRVKHVSFTETLQAEIRFDDGREVVLSGELAAELRDAVQRAIRAGIASAKSSRTGEVDDTN